MLTYSGDQALILGGGCAIGRRLAALLLAAGKAVTVTVTTPERCQPVAAAILAERARTREPDHANGAYGLSDADAPNGSEPPDCPPMSLSAEGASALRVLPLALEDMAVHPAALENVLRCEGVFSVPHYVVDCMHPHMEGYVSAVEPEAAGAYFATAVSARHAILYSLTRHMLAARRSRCGGRGAANFSGRLLHVSSTAVIMPNAGQGFYAAAKSAAETLYRTLGIELAPRGITTAILRAGYVAAGRGQTYLTEHPEVLRSIPLGRAQTAEEVAAALLWLLSDQATGINATAITMDGGMTASKNTTCR